MTFGRYLRLFSLLLVLTGFYSILITQSYVVSVLIGVGVTLAYGFLGDKLSEMIPVPRWFWNAAALLLLTYFTYDSFFGSLDLVGNGIMFVVYLQVVKLLSPKTDRDWLGIYGLSFLHLLASTVLSSDLAFAVPFLLYVVFAAWTMALFNLKLAQQEAARPERRATVLRNLFASEDVITSRFLEMTSVLSIVIIFTTLIIFFSFPRLSMGQFLKRIARTQQVTGFSDQVELGAIGSIKTNSTIALRVEIPEESVKKLDIEHLYWRGTAADRFDGHTWSQSVHERQRIYVDLGKPTLETAGTGDLRGQPFRYTVFLEALSTPLIFGADLLTRVTWSKTILERIFRGSLVLEANSMYRSFHFQNVSGYLADLTYQAESVIGEPDPEVLRGERGEMPREYASYFLQLPELHPEVRQLIQAIPVPKGSMYDRAVAIQKFLEKKYRYTLNVQDVGTDDPLRFFLVERKAGHCEYFSTALAVALRMHGIPAREVMGFRGGELNPYGRYIAVRQRDAHSWVEVFFPTFGWIRFDPSPLDGTVRAAGTFLRPLVQFVDYLRLRWNKYIIEYDLRSQAAILERIGRRVAQMARAQQDTDDSGRDSARKLRSFGRWLPDMALYLAIACLVGLFLFGKPLRRLWRRRSAQSRYREVLDLLASKGHRKKPFQTAKEFQAVVERREGPLRSFSELTRMYYEEKFGGNVCDEVKWRMALVQLKKEMILRRRDLRRRASSKPRRVA